MSTIGYKNYNIYHVLCPWYARRASIGGILSRPSSSWAFPATPDSKQSFLSCVIFEGCTLSSTWSGGIFFAAFRCTCLPRNTYPIQPLRITPPLHFNDKIDAKSAQNRCLASCTCSASHGEKHAPHRSRCLCFPAFCLVSVTPGRSLNKGKTTNTDRTVWCVFDGVLGSASGRRSSLPFLACALASLCVASDPPAELRSQYFGWDTDVPFFQRFCALYN